MSDPAMTLANLTADERRLADDWLKRFDTDWSEDRLAELLKALPADSALRRPLLVAMIERDLAYHWKHGRPALLSGYFDAYPELGGADHVPLDLIVAEYHLRKEHGQADLADFAEMYPSRIDDLYLLVKPELDDVANPASPNADKTILRARRLELLKAPAPDDSESDAGAAERRRQLLLQGMEAPPSADVSPEPATAEPPQTSPIGAAPPPVAGPPPPDEIAAAPRLGPYTLQRALGDATHPTVFLATDSQLNREVVLKLPHLPDENREAIEAYFFKEARAAATISHPSLCPVLDAGAIDGVSFLVMPYVTGTPLSQEIETRPVWPPSEALGLIARLASAMDVAHRHGVLHRDLRPANVLITAGNIPVIVDLGYSLQAEETANPNDEVYFAPESTEAEIGPAADVYSLGVMLYRLLCGKLPNVQSEKITPPSAIVPEVPAELDAVCLKAIARDPTKRYGTMKELSMAITPLIAPSRQLAKSDRISAPAIVRPGASLAELRRLSAIIPKPPDPPMNRVFKQANRIWLVVGGLGAAVVTIVALAYFMGGSSPPTSTAERKIEETDEQVIAGLKASDLATRQLAAEKIKARGLKSAANALIHRIADDDWADSTLTKDESKIKALEALNAVAPDKVPDALIQALRSKTAQVRVWAMLEIVRGKDDELFVPPLIRALIDEYPRIRKLAADKLGRLHRVYKSPEIVKALAARVADDLWEPSSNDPRATENLHDPEFGGKQAALEALTEISPSDAMRALENAVLKSTHRDVRSWAKRELRDVRRPKE
jgi:serine/threonine protein kinase